jgi:hypothetical protein
MGARMTDQQFICLEEIKSILSGLSSIKYVGYFPDDIKMIGNKFPAVLIRDGDTEYDLPVTNKGISIVMQVVIYLYANYNVGRLENLLELERLILDEILFDITLNGKAIMVKPVAVEKGEYSETVSKYEAGYYPNLSVRKIYLEITIYDTRSL